ALLLGEDTPEFNESGDITCGREGQINEGHQEPDNRLESRRPFRQLKAAADVAVGEIIIHALLLGEDTPEFNESGDITCGREGQINEGHQEPDNRLESRRPFRQLKAAADVAVGEIIIRI
ncbi:hypothetical protein CDAR_232891, partial [Caerostris darwini]